MAKTTYQYEYSAEKKYKKNDFEKDFFELINDAVFGKNYGECEKTQRHQVCKNQSKKKLFSARTELSHNKKFFPNIY